MHLRDLLNDITVKNRECDVKCKEFELRLIKNGNSPQIYDDISKLITRIEENCASFHKTLKSLKKVPGFRIDEITPERDKLIIGNNDEGTTSPKLSHSTNLEPQLNRTDQFGKEGDVENGFIVEEIILKYVDEDTKCGENSKNSESECSRSSTTEKDSQETLLYEYQDIFNNEAEQSGDSSVAEDMSSQTILFSPDLSQLNVKLCSNKSDMLDRISPPSSQISELHKSSEKNEDLMVELPFNQSVQNADTESELRITYSERDAEEALNMIYYSTSSSSCSSLESLFDSDSEDGDLMVEQFLDEDYLFKKFNLKECYVLLERINFDENEIAHRKCHSTEDLSKICDERSLNRKRHAASESSNENSNMRPKRSKINEFIDSSSSSGYDEEDISLSSIHNEKIVDTNDFLAEVVCKTISESPHFTSFCDDIDDNLNSPKVDEKCTIRSPENKIGSEKKKRLKKKKWQTDPLLKGWCSSSSDSENEIVRVKRMKLFRRISQSSRSENENSEKQMNEDISSDITNSIVKSEDDLHIDDSPGTLNASEDDLQISDSTVSFKSKKSDVDSSSDVRMDEEKVANPILFESLDTDEGQDKKKGRKNIRPVLCYTELAEATKKAKEQEDDRISRLEERQKLALSQTTVADENLIILDTDNTGYDLTIDPGLSNRLYAHQEEGIKFLWEACYESLERLKEDTGSGCILAHCMGLGKTFQVITLIHTLFYHKITNTKHVLIVCPLSTVAGWKKEFKLALSCVKYNTEFSIDTIGSSNDTHTKYEVVKKWKQGVGVIIMGYEAFEILTNHKKTPPDMIEDMREALVNPGPQLIVCDEGHLLKNGRTLKTQALMRVETRRRIVLTGTPLQNNLNEYFHMIQFVKPHLLGTSKEYKNRFVNPIVNGQYEDSSSKDINLMKKRSHVLNKLLKNTIQRYEMSELKKYIPHMKDYAVFIQLHPLQEKLYKHYIETVLNNTKLNKRNWSGFFKDYQILKLICSHPFLLYTLEKRKTQRKKKELDIIHEEPEVQAGERIPRGWWKTLCPDNFMNDISFGHKLEVMFAIIEASEKIGDKVLIFTSNLSELDTIEYFLKLIGTGSCPSWKARKDYFRMDGTVPPSTRTLMCDLFNDVNNKRLRLFLMSHKVGGLGLNLTAANRVILLGANFNPSYDSQSIFRVYRFGQKKCVYVYRLLSMGTMEEKVYQRCVTKLAVASRVVDEHQIDRHYNHLDLQDIYTVSIDLSLEKSVPNKPEDDLLAALLLKFECIHKYHEHQSLLENRPNEELDDDDKNRAWEEFKQDCEEKNEANTSLSKLPTIHAEMDMNLPASISSSIETNASLRLPVLENNHLFKNPNEVRNGAILDSNVNQMLSQRNRSFVTLQDTIRKIMSDMQAKPTYVLANNLISNVNGTDKNRMKKVNNLREVLQKAGVTLEAVQKETPLIRNNFESTNNLTTSINIPSSSSLNVLDEKTSHFEIANATTKENPPDALSIYDNHSYRPETSRGVAASHALLETSKSYVDFKSNSSISNVHQLLENRKSGLKKSKTITHDSKINLGRSIDDHQTSFLKSNAHHTLNKSDTIQQHNNNTVQTTGNLKSYSIQSEVNIPKVPSNIQEHLVGNAPQINRTNSEIQLNNNYQNSVLPTNNATSRSMPIKWTHTSSKVLRKLIDESRQMEVNVPCSNNNADTILQKNSDQTKGKLLKKSLQIRGNLPNSYKKPQESTSQTSEQEIHRGNYKKPVLNKVQTLVSPSIPSTKPQDPLAQIGSRKKIENKSVTPNSSFNKPTNPLEKILSYYSGGNICQVPGSPSTKTTNDTVSTSTTTAYFDKVNNQQRQSDGMTLNAAQRVGIQSKNGNKTKITAISASKSDGGEEFIKNISQTRDQIQSPAPTDLKKSVYINNECRATWNPIIQNSKTSDKSIKPNIPKRERKKSIVNTSVQRNVSLGKPLVTNSTQLSKEHERKVDREETGHLLSLNASSDGLNTTRVPFNKYNLTNADKMSSAESRNGCSSKTVIPPSKSGQNAIRDRPITNPKLASSANDLVVMPYVDYVNSHVQYPNKATTMDSSLRYEPRKYENSVQKIQPKKVNNPDETEHLPKK